MQRWSGAWAWLLARPEPMKPPRRIVTIAAWIAALALAFALPDIPKAARSALSDALSVLIGLCVVGLVLTLVWAYVSKRRRRGRRAPYGDS